MGPHHHTTAAFTAQKVTAPLLSKTIQFSFTSIAWVTSAWEFALCFFKSWPDFSEIYSSVYAGFQGDDHLPLLLLASSRSEPLPPSSSPPHIPPPLPIPLSLERAARDISTSPPLAHFTFLTSQHFPHFPPFPQQGGIERKQTCPFLAGEPVPTKTMGAVQKQFKLLSSDGLDCVCIFSAKSSEEEV